MYKKIIKYFSKNVLFGNTIHAIGGLGVGLLLYPYISGNNTVAIGIVLLVLSLLGHVYAAFAK